MAHVKVLDCVINHNWSLICDLYCAWNNQVGFLFVIKSCILQAFERQLMSLQLDGFAYTSVSYLLILVTLCQPFYEHPLCCLLLSGVFQERHP